MLALVDIKKAKLPPEKQMLRCIVLNPLTPCKRTKYRHKLEHKLEHNVTTVADSEQPPQYCTGM